MAVDGEKTSKPINWHDSYNLLIREKITSIQSRKTQGDVFYKLFLGDVCIGVHCEKDCKYKFDQSAADIRIGDLWGDAYKDDEKGTSALIVFTEKGNRIVEDLKDVTLIEHPFALVAEGQMRKNAYHKETTPIVMYFLRNGYSLSGFLFKATLYTQRVITKVKRIIKK